MNVAKIWYNLTLYRQKRNRTNANASVVVDLTGAEPEHG